MSHLLWKSYWENDVERFRRLLTSPATSSQQAGGSTPGGKGNYGSLGASPRTFGSSPKPNSKRKTSGLGNSSAKPGLGGSGLSRHDINSRDHAGLTVLLRASASTDSDASKFVQALLEHPAIDLYVQDLENGWNALHRALYFGNASIARMLLDKERIDLTSHTSGSVGKVGLLIKTKDHEGWSPFDLYNSTLLPVATSSSAARRSALSPDVEDDPEEIAAVDHLYQLPTSRHVGDVYTRRSDELFMFGSNRNLSLGVGDEDDRQYPERIHLQRSEQLIQYLHEARLGSEDTENPFSTPVDIDIPNLTRSQPIEIVDVVLSKLHSAVITSDPITNLFICGVGRGGRLGLGDENTRFKFTPIQGPLTDKSIKRVALGQNHSMAVTDGGELWTWGLNTDSQLGYTLPPPLRADEEPMSLVPRQVFGTLKKESVIGVAASAHHSVCHTGLSLYCWGRNAGQLALMDADSRSLDVQQTPRKVAASLLTAPIQMVSAIERATTCLLSNHSVWVFTNYGYNLVKFPIPDVFSNSGLSLSFNPYDPERREIHFVASGGETIAAINSGGELFTMHLNKAEANHPAGSTTNPVKIKSALTSPQCVWDSRKDMAVSADVGDNGSVILCTRTGAVWRRVQRPKGRSAAFAGASDSKRKDFKFERVSYITNCVSVRSSCFGAFAAVRVDNNTMSTKLQISPENLSKDIGSLLCLNEFVSSEPHQRDLASRKQWFAAIERDLGFPPCRRQILKSSDIEGDLSEWLSFNRPAAKTDLVIRTNLAPNLKIPIHSWLLTSRSSSLRKAIVNFRNEEPFESDDLYSFQIEEGEAILSLADADVYTLLNLVLYVYWDTVVPVWKFTKELPTFAYRFRQVRTEVMKFASKLKMPGLEAASRLQVNPTPCLPLDLSKARLDPGFFEDGDVIIQLEDADVSAHSQLLCQRCPFFEGMFYGRSQGQWLAGRREEQDRVTIDLQHVSSSTFDYVMAYLYGDTGSQLFDQVALPTIDDFSELVLDVMAVANELMLDRLSEICQHAIGKFVNARNVANLLNEISPCTVTMFKDNGFNYIFNQLELMLENHLLDNLDEDLLAELDKVIQDNQRLRYPHARGAERTEHLHAIDPHLATDIEEERRRWPMEMAFKNTQREEERKLSSSWKGRYGSFEESPMGQTPDGHRRKSRGSRNEPFSPDLRPRASQGDFMFDMDEEEYSGLSSPQGPSATLSHSRPEFDGEDMAQFPAAWDSDGKGKESVQFNEKPLSSSPAPGWGLPGQLSPASLTAGSGRNSSTAGIPWAKTPLTAAKLDLKDIMTEASSSSALSTELAAQARKEGSVHKSTNKMSQKERKKQLHMQTEALVASGTEAASQVPWENVPSRSKIAAWKMASQAPLKTSLKDAMSAETGQSPAAAHVKPLVASEANPQASKRRTASPDTRFSGQNRTHSSPAVPTTSKQANKTPTVPHSKSYMQPKPKAEPILGLGMADIIGQQKREQEMVKEAVAKRSLQEIQQEQAFQEWWDLESRRAQEEEARRVVRNHKVDKDSKRGRKGKGAKGRVQNTAEHGSKVVSGANDKGSGVNNSEKPVDVKGERSVGDNNSHKGGYGSTPSTNRGRGGKARGAATRSGNQQS